MTIAVILRILYHFREWYNMVGGEYLSAKLSFSICYNIG